MVWAMVGPDLDVTYIDLAMDNYRAVLRSDEHDLLIYLARNVAAVASAWMNALLIFWREPIELRFVIASLLGLLALSGTALRAKKAKLDALYVLCYLAIVVVWPFRNEMPRFLYPVLPLLILHAYFAFSSLLTRLANAGAPAWAVLDANGDYVLVSEAVARGNWDGMGAYPRFAPFSELVWQRIDAGTGLRQFALLKMDRARLKQLAGVGQ